MTPPPLLQDDCLHMPPSIHARPIKRVKSNVAVPPKHVHTLEIERGQLRNHCERGHQQCHSRISERTACTPATHSPTIHSLLRAELFDTRDVQQDVQGGGRNGSKHAASPACVQAAAPEVEGSIHFHLHGYVEPQRPRVRVDFESATKAPKNVRNILPVEGGRQAEPPLKADCVARSLIRDARQAAAHFLARESELQERLTRQMA